MQLCTLTPSPLYYSSEEHRSAMAFNLCCLHDTVKDPLEAIHLLWGMGLLQVLVHVQSAKLR